MDYEELVKELYRLKHNFFLIDINLDRRNKQNVEVQNYQVVKSRRHDICERFFIDWFTQNVPKLAKEYDVSEETILADIMSNEFKMLFMNEIEVPSQGTMFDTEKDHVRVRYQRAIQIAAISSNDRLIALCNTLDAIRHYIEKIKKAVIVSNRFHAEAMLVSKTGAETGEKCEKCGAPMRLVNPYGHDSYFAGCSNYPECYNAKQITVEMLEKIPRVIDRYDKAAMEEVIERLVPQEAHWHPVIYQEDTTRKELIDPILKALGWETYESTDVKREIKTSAGKVDYILYSSEDEPYAVVEAKKLFTDLSKHRFQILSYMDAIPVSLGILTNGFDWDVFGLIGDREADKIFSIRDIIYEDDQEKLRKFTDLISKK